MSDELFADMATTKAPAEPEDHAAILQDLRHKPWRHASASQITTFRRCQLRWWFGKVAGLSDPESKALTYGKLLHAEAETYLVTGRSGWAPTDDADTLKARELILVARAAGRLPPEGSVPRADVERAFALVDPNWPVPVVGAIDWMVGDEIDDHKTLSAWKYMRTEEALREDVAGAIYSAAACGKAPEVPTPDVVVHGGESGPDRLYPVVKAPSPIQLRSMRFRHVYYLTLSPIDKMMGALPDKVARRLNGDTKAILKAIRTSMTRDIKDRVSHLGDTTPSVYVELATALATGLRSIGIGVESDAVCNDLVATEQATLASRDKTQDYATNTDERAVTLDPSTICVNLNGIANTLWDMAVVAKATGPREVKHNTEACYDHGKCPRQGLCAFLGIDVYRRQNGKEKETVNDNPFLDSFGAEPTAPATPAALSLKDRLNAVEQEKARAAGMQAAEDPEKPADVAEKKAEKPKKLAVVEPAIPNDERLPKEVRGFLRKHLDASGASRVRSLLATACKAAGHNVVVVPEDSRKPALIEGIAQLVAMLTGERPWPPEGPKADKAAPKHVPMEDAPSTSGAGDLDEAFSDYPTRPAANSGAEALAAKPTEEPAPESITPVAGPAITPDAQCEDTLAVVEPERWLYIDCQPRSGADVVELSDFLSPIHRMIEAEKGVGHYLALGYGEGPKLTGALLYRGLKSGRFRLPRELIVRRSMPCAQECLAELGPYYERERVIEASR